MNECTKLLTRYCLLIFAVALSAHAFSFQTITVTGVVIEDETNAPLPAATVSVIETKQQTLTGNDGSFTLENVAPGAQITVSYIGYRKQSFKATQADDDLVISLRIDEKSLDDVVVIGYGTVQKSDLTGSVSSINARDIVDAGSVSLDQALAGKAAGVVVVQNSGIPGGGANVRVRGISSISGTEPLYVIDGVPLNTEENSTIGFNANAGGALSPLANINPNDIQSIEVLKDASATAIYGSRGANGVVLITTKTGSEAKRGGTIQFSSEYGVSEVIKTVDLLDANDFVLYRYEEWLNNGLSPDRFPQIDTLDDARAGLIEGTDWQDYIYRQGDKQDYNISFRGNTDEVNYALTASYLKTNGIIEETNLDRYNVRLNLDANVSKTFEVGTRLNFSRIYSDQKNTSTSIVTARGSNSVVNRALNTSPISDIDDGFNDDTGLFSSPTPRASIEANHFNSTNAQFVGNIHGQINFSDAVSFRSQASYQTRNNDQDYYQDAIQRFATLNRSGEAQSRRTKRDNITITNRLNINKRFKRGHRVDGVLGQSYESTTTNGLRISNGEFSNDKLSFYAPGTALFQDPDTFIYSNEKLLSYFGRANYSYKNLATFTLTGRLDGSSKFAENNKFGFFPAAALLLKPINLKGLKNSYVLSDFKVRLSYGSSGSQSIQPYQSLDQFTPEQQVMFINGEETLVPAFYRSSLPNPNLQWEESTQKNAAIDFGFWDNRITGSLDVYQKLTNKLLFASNAITVTSGFQNYTENLGQLETNGVELDLNSYLVDKKNFSLSLGIRASTGKTKINDLGTEFISNGYNPGFGGEGSQRFIEGEYIGTFWGYATNGISQFDDFEEFQGLSEEEQIALYNQDLIATYTPVDPSIIAERPGQQLIADLNPDGIINSSDRTALGNAQPDAMFGMNLGIDYKNFTLRANLDSQVGGKIFNVNNLRIFDFAQGQSLQKAYDEAWRAESPSKIYPRIDRGNDLNGDRNFNTRYIEDASFLRLQNIRLQYGFPRKFSNDIGIQRLNLYANTTNVFMISNYSGYSPDVSVTGNRVNSIGHDSGAYPQGRSINFGINATF